MENPGKRKLGKNRIFITFSRFVHDFTTPGNGPSWRGDKNCGSTRTGCETKN